MAEGGRGPDGVEPNSAGGWRSFHDAELPELLDELEAAGELVVEEGGRSLRVLPDHDPTELRLVLPLVRCPLPAGASWEDCRAALAGPPGLQAVVLVQAGASALGLWWGHELVEHKVIKKYVVRGRGRAQPAYRDTRGKSRAGSRLRLANAERQLAQTAEKLGEWLASRGRPERVLWSCPVRARGAYREALEEVLGDPDAWVRIPVDVRVPNLGELRRVRGILERGRLEELR